MRGELPARSAGTRLRFPFTVFAVTVANAVVKAAPPSRRRPPSSNGTGPSREIIDPPSTSAGPCDAVFHLNRRRRPTRRRLFLLPTLRRFLRLSFRFSSLRHCCPPSLSGWRYRCSAVANRSALQPDYYSRKKITVTPLNFVCRRRRRARRTDRAKTLRRVAVRKNFFGARCCRTTFATGENADEICVFATLYFL